jgi:hypothetical protein
MPVFPKLVEGHPNVQAAIEAEGKIKYELMLWHLAE